jgi:quercetin dioxygenase-like cupin family protein
MQIADLPFNTVVWQDEPVTVHKGETGEAHWRTRHFGPMRVRMVEYTPGYFADHWCVKGHVLFVIEGEMTTELEDGRTFEMKAGTSYQVADNAEPHRSFTKTGAKLFIVD